MATNHRLTAVNENSVSFTYKDYRDEGKQKQTTLEGVEFLRRFADDILPASFVRVRHYGFLASRNKPKELNIAYSSSGSRNGTRSNTLGKQSPGKSLALALPDVRTAEKKPLLS